MDEIIKQNLLMKLDRYFENKVDAKKMKSFINSIKEGEYFFLFLDELSQTISDECILALKYYNEYDTNKSLFDIDDYVMEKMRKKFELGKIADEFIEIINEKYSIENFSYFKKHRLGESDKSKRICRFCKRSANEGASFKKIAHAIPELLGNKNLLLNEECDDCNSMFGESIERDLARFTHLSRAVAGVKGKRGPAKIKQANFSITQEECADTKSLKTVIKMDNCEGVKYSSESYSPMNVYRALCKIYLSVIDNYKLSDYDELIKWVKFDIDIDYEFSPIAVHIVKGDLFERAEVVTYIRHPDLNNSDCIEALLELKFGNMIIVAIIPELGIVNNDHICENLRNAMTTFPHFKGTPFKFIDLDSKTNVKLHLINVKNHKT